TGQGDDIGGGRRRAAPELVAIRERRRSGLAPVPGQCERADVAAAAVGRKGSRRGVFRRAVGAAAEREERAEERGEGAGAHLARRAWIAAWRASSRSARTTTGTSIILPSTANEARPSAFALSLPSMMRLASATSSAEGEYSSLTTVTCAGWMQVAPRNPNWRDRFTIVRNASRSAKLATLAM